MGEYLDSERDERGVQTITLHHGKVNALCVELLNELRDAAESCGHGSGVRCVVITGGERLFAAGADITQFAQDPTPEHFEIADPERVRQVGLAFLEALNAVAAIPVPTIASVSGFALGGGCELALACDLRIASTKATFGQPEILLGIIPGGGGTQRLARLVGPSVAKDLIFSGRQVKAPEALRIGLANEVVEPESLNDRVGELAGSFAAGPTLALAAAKLSIDEGLSGTLHDGLLVEQREFVGVFATEDASTGVRSFLEHGPGAAKFSGQ
jgi:enoyl-CoA hydratase/carnithine racemase